MSPLSERSRRVLPAWILGIALLAAAPVQAGINRWTSIGPDGGGVSALAFSANGRTAWAGTQASGVFRSADNGRTWTTASRGLSGEVHDLAASFTAPGRVYAATSFGVFRSDDAGLHWTAANTGLPSGNGRVDARLVATEPTAPAAVWAVVPNTRALYRSTNLGARWRYAGRGLGGFVLDLATHPRTAGVVFAATNKGLYRSADSGGTWSPSGLKGRVVSRIVFDRVQPRHLYAITLEAGHHDIVGGTVFVSDDGGASWKRGSEQPSAFGSYELAADPAHAGTAWMSVTGVAQFSVFKTTDGGQHWQGVLESIGSTALAANPLRSGVVLAGHLEESFTAGEEPALFRTDDGGTSWSPSDAGIATQIVRKVVPDPSKPGALYAQGVCCSLWRRTGAGQPFTPVPTHIDQLGFAELILDPKTPSTLYLATALPVYKSVDAGATWQSTHSPSMVSIALDPAHPSTLYGTPTILNAVYRSEDGGLSWNALSGSAGLYATRVTMTGRAVYANGYDSSVPYRDRLRRSTDGGTTWTTLLELNLDNALVSAVAEDRSDPRRLWTAFVQLGGPQLLPTTGGVFRSTDGGAHWSLSRVPGNLPVFALAVDPRNSNRVWAASVGDVFVSENGGATWVSSGEGLPSSNVLDLRLDPFDPDTLYAGTNGGSVYVFTRRAG